MGEQADRLLVAFSNEQQMKIRHGGQQWSGRDWLRLEQKKQKSNQKCIRAQWAVHTIRQLTNREATVTI